MDMTSYCNEDERVLTVPAWRHLIEIDAAVDLMMNLTSDSLSIGNRKIMYYNRALEVLFVFLAIRLSKLREYFGAVKNECSDPSQPFPR